MAFGVCSSVINEILGEKGISKRYTTEELMVEFVGKNFGGMLTELNKIHSIGLTEDIIDMYTDKEVELIVEKIKTDLEPTTGAYEKVKQIYNSKKYKIAVVSSSTKVRLVASMKKTKLSEFFPDSMLFSAASSLEKPTTKPNPAIYLFAAKSLGTDPAQCLAIEDSVSGVKSAVNAGIKTIGYVGAYHTPELKGQVGKQLLAAGAYVVIHSWPDLDKAMDQCP